MCTESTLPQETQLTFSLQTFCSGDYKVSSKDLQMDCVVDTLRSTHSHLVLRDALRLLTQAVQLAPVGIFIHIS